MLPTSCAQFLERTDHGDIMVGRVEVPISDIVLSRDINPVTDRAEAGVFARTLRLEETDCAEVQVILRWIPYFWT